MHEELILTGDILANLTLSDIVDVFSKSGTPKATKVKQIKYRDEYQPATDYYRTLRTSLVEIHSQGKDRAALDTIVPSLTDPKKTSNYSELVEAYRKFWGRKDIGWFTPPRGSYSFSQIDVLVNPELGLIIDGKPVVVKLYLKGDDVSKAQINLIPVLMEVVLRPQVSNGALMALLDVRKGKMHFLGTSSISAATAMINAELSYVATLWPTL